jgi:esterase/lipase
LSNDGQNKPGGAGRRRSGDSRRRSSGSRRSTRSAQGPAQSGRNRPTSRAAAQSNKPEPAKPAVKPAAASKPSPITQNLTLTAWDLARTRKGPPDTARGQVMTLRAHQRLVASFEKERAIPDPDRSFLRVREDARGSVLLIHGVSTGPGDLRVLANELFENDYNVYVLRLPDYGTPGHTISEVSWESSLYQARQCFQLLGRGGGKVHVVGLGFGATLALHVARKESVASLVLLSPAIMAKASLIQKLLVRFKLHHLKVVHRLVGWNADLMEGMDKARGHVGKLRVPVYAAQCEDDDRASPLSLRFLQRKANHKASRFQIFPNGGHAILAEHGERVLFREIVKFCDG